MQDPFEKNVPGLGLGRDPERTPMQWDAAPNAGFTTGEPWLPLAADADAVNVAAQRDDPDVDAHALPRACSRCAAREPGAVRRAATSRSTPTGDVLAYVREATATVASWSR